MFFNLFSGCPCNKTDAFKHVPITQEGQLFAWYSLPPHHFSARYVKIGEKQCKLQTTTAPLSWNWMGKQKLHAVYSLYVNVKRHASSLIASKLGLVKVYLLLARVAPTRNDNRDSPKYFICALYILHNKQFNDDSFHLPSWETSKLLFLSGRFPINRRWCHVRCVTFNFFLNVFRFFSRFEFGAVILTGKDEKWVSVQA
jgi:hypothetical protein